jgi:hypothetical protein
MSKNGFNPIYIGLEDNGVIKAGTLILIKDIFFGIKLN